ncbi:MAG: penicillin-binding transpeptidase domain-containing protein [Gemmatimonadales bacterium]
MTRPNRVGLVHLGLALFAIAIVGKAARIQLGQQARWAARAERQQSTERTVPAPRGDILDAEGAMLAQSRETVRLDVAPPEVKDPASLRMALLRAGVPVAFAARAADLSRKWVPLPGRYPAAELARVTAMRGVYTTPVVERAYSSSVATRRIIGHVDADGKALDGVELALDSILSGRPGSTTIMRDGRGRRFESPTAPTVEPIPGNSVTLTINQQLQEIAERALSDAVARMGAEGGDVVVLDPANGDVLAMASQRQDPRAATSTALTEPYEPGSTLKPFIAATLLEKGRARETDVVDTYSGQLTINGRTINDEHAAARLNLADVLRFSSNIGIVQFAQRLSPREEYEALRDFGFGMATGLAYPVEAAGTLREPARWSKQSANSLAMGYEIAVTPLQLAAAYVALANGGELLQPQLVKEIHSPGGDVLYRRERRVVRRVVSPAVARRVRTMLLGVVEGGTAVHADLGSFALAGKTGTARRTVNGRYAVGEHIPTFVGLFPADRPQFVILVKIDNPKGAYGGGLTAAPVTKAVLEAALASRDAALDRGELAASRKDVTRDSSQTRADGLHVAPAVGDSPDGSTPFVALLSSPALPTPRRLPPRAVPDVHGLPIRRAVHLLNSAGFRVQLVAIPLTGTSPAAGTMAPAGSLVRLPSAP